MGKEHNNKHIPSLDRNRAAAARKGPWQPLMPVEIVEEDKQRGILAAFRNNLYLVGVSRTVSNGFFMQGADGRPQPVPIVHLIISRHDRKQPPWRDLQRIKSELVHPESDAVELYPSVQREINLSQTMLWCMPPGYTMPVGLAPPAAAPGPDDEIVPGHIRRSDLQFYVIETPQPHGEAPIIEVFADEADARESYESTDVAFPEGGAVRMFGQIPEEEEGAAWSPAAVARREDLSQRIAEAGAHMAQQQAEAEDRARLPCGNPGIEEEMDAAEAWEKPLCDGPLEPEEAANLGELMQQGMQRRAAERDVVISDEVRAAEAAGDKQAQDDLAAMRERFVQTGKIDGPTEPSKPN
jgi:hypothetical protein